MTGMRTLGRRLHVALYRREHNIPAPRRRKLRVVAAPRRVALSLLVLCAASAPALADRLYPVQPADALERARASVHRARPQLTPEEVEAIANPGGLALPAIRAALAPAPLLRDSVGPYFQGRIESVVRGAHGDDWLDEANHDSFLFSAYGQGGRQASAKPAVISTHKLYRVVHEFDTLQDFVWLLSDRHRRLGVRFGSPRHRDAILSLADPAGAMGLLQGDPVTVAAGRGEGRVTRYILDGAPQGAALIRALRWRRWDPAYLLQFGLARQERIDVGTFDILVGLARAAKYPGFAPEFAGYARAAIGILCTLALSDPGLAEPRDRDAARRAAQIGRGCFHTISWTLNGAEFGVPRHAAALTGALPVTRREVTDVALDALLSEPVFARYDEADFLPEAPVPREKVSWGDRVQAGGKLSYVLTRELVTLAAAAGPLAARAERVLVHLMYAAPDAGGGEPVDQRHFRSLLYDALLGDDPKKEKLARNVLCAFGWGHPNDSRALIPGIMSIALARDAPSALGRRRIRLLALMLQTGKRRPADRLLVEMIEHEVGQVREAVRLGNANPGGVDFLRRFDALMATRLACPEF